MLAAPRLVRRRRGVRCVWLLFAREESRMTHEVGRLRRRVHALGPRHRGARVPPALRAAIATYARDEQAAGTSCGAIAERLGGSAESIRRWAVTEPGRGDRALVPVHVGAGAAA